jgi:hypothetical protein
MADVRVDPSWTPTPHYANLQQQQNRYRHSFKIFYLYSFLVLSFSVLTVHHIWLNLIIFNSTSSLFVNIKVYPK